MDVTLTPRALAKLRSTAEREAVNLETTVLRVAVVPGGCSGLAYDLGWDTTVRETDSVTELGDLRVVVDVRSRLYLEGTTLDFSEGLNGRGFHFENPQAARTCACGESFGL